MLLLITAPEFTVYKMDRESQSSEKSGDRGVCFMLNDRLCREVSDVSKSCSPVLKQLTINCTPCYSPREFSSIVLLAVTFPSWLMLHPLLETPLFKYTMRNGLSRQRGDRCGWLQPYQLFPSKALPRYYQHVTYHTRHDQTRPLLYNHWRCLPHATPLIMPCWS